MEVYTPSTGRWEAICGDGWSLLEAMVVCRSLSLGYAKDAMQTTYFGGNLTRKSYSGVKCLGHERSLSQCLHDESALGFCEGRDVAAVYCVDKMADLVSGIISVVTFCSLTQKFFILKKLQQLNNTVVFVVGI